MPNYSEMWEKYKQEVLNRVQNPGQTLATALEQGMPTEEQPLGMFGLGGITKMHGTPSVFKTPRKEPIPWKYDEPSLKIPEGYKMSTDNTVITLPEGVKMYKLEDGGYIDETGKISFKSLKELLERPPDVFKSNRPSSPFYKDPFKDTTQ